MIMRVTQGSRRRMSVQTGHMNPTASGAKERMHAQVPLGLRSGIGEPAHFRTGAAQSAVPDADPARLPPAGTEMVLEVLPSDH